MGLRSTHFDDRIFHLTNFNWDDFVKDANAQHGGGSSFARGAEFQKLVEASELLKFAASLRTTRKGGNPTFASEVRGSRVDDLHVIWEDEAFAWRYQIKARVGQKWDLKLETQFKQERHFFPNSRFYLVVHDDELAVDLQARSADSGLDFVQVDSLDIRILRAPHNDDGIKEHLDCLLDQPVQAAHHAATWTALFGTWVRLREGKFSELWEEVCSVSKYVLCPLESPEPEAHQRASNISKKLGSLSVAADGEIIVLSDGVFSSRIRGTTEMALTNNEHWLPLPENAWQLFEKLGSEVE